jgi:hypothetical protein
LQYRQWYGQPRVANTAPFIVMLRFNKSHLGAGNKYEGFVL